MATFTQLKTEITRYGGLGAGASDTASVAAWAKGGLRLIGRLPWPWTRVAWTQALTANVYAYSIRTINAYLTRIDAKSVRYGGATTYLTWAPINAIDATLGPDWKDAASSGGTPEYVARVGAELWIAGKPNADFIGTGKTLSGFGWREENWDEDVAVNGGHLLLPEEFFEVAVECALAYGFHEEDDPRADTFMNRWLNVHRPDMLATLDPGSNSHMNVPYWVFERDNGAEAYGDR